MLYREAGSADTKVSQLGLGCMRFKKHAGVIDQAAAEEVMEAALAGGINYFDTAYAYAGNEECLGRFIAKGNRDRFYLATKLPHYQCKSAADFDRMFDEELRRLQTDHVDFYLIHMLTSLTSWQRAVDMGIEEFIAERKASGQIRRIGFSFHGGVDDFMQVVDAYPWDFCQIQLNYLDANAQAGLKGLHHAARKGLPVIVMEPLRGGRLAGQLPPGAQRLLTATEPRQSAASWGLQWLYNLPEVTCVLSGMNEVAQVEENCELAGRVGAGSLSANQMAVYHRVIDEIKKTEKVGCTGCGYCMPCPHGVDIPSCFRAYNDSFADKWMSGFQEYLMTTSFKAEPANAGRCVGCGRCETRCPQRIPIHSEMVNVRKRLEGFRYKTVMRFKGFGFKV